MHGTFQTPDLLSAALAQQTLRTAIDCTGVGVHSGRKVQMTLRPAAVNTGIVFRRTDLGVSIPARFDHVVDTRLCTVLGLPGRREAVVGTVEHVMAALHGAGISNAEIEIDGAEVPISWVAVGDPAQMFPPKAHDEIWAVQRTLDFAGTVTGLAPEALAEGAMSALTQTYAELYGRHREDRVIGD